ncbi:MAG TPA: hypothetical protein VEU62_11080, partial [Bryobacterales bacterium]|nr:hypothetical protein [Bryobacterales bacterium]
MRLAASFACLAVLVLFTAACRRNNVTTVSPTAGLIHLTMPGRTVHNSHYLSQSFLYQLQTLVGTAPASPKVLDGRIVERQGKEFYLDLHQLPADKAAILQRIAAQQPPAGEMSMDELEAYMLENYYKLTGPYPNLKALLRENPYRDNPNWLAIPVDSVTFRRRRVLHINKDRIADALVAYFGNNDRLIFLEGTIIAAESFDKQGNFVEAEVLRKRADTFWNFSIYDVKGALVSKSVAFDEDGKIAPEREGFHVPRTCAMCHRMDRLDFSGDPDAPVLAPVRGFFQELPARVPQIHLGPEYYDHMAFTELTEASGKVKDGVFGVYGSLLLSELAGRKRLGTLTADDKARYRRLAPYFPELLQPLDRVDSLTNSIGMRLIRIPAPHPNSKIGSPLTDPEHRPDERRHTIRFQQAFFLGVYDVTNAQFRRFR